MVTNFRGINILTSTMRDHQSISASAMLHVQEIYALENVVFYSAVYGPFKP